MGDYDNNKEEKICSVYQYVMIGCYFNQEWITGHQI